jgi:isopentenyl phosphate kinase
MEQQLFFVKLGGSLITNKKRPYTARPEVIARAAAELHRARKHAGMALLVGHGGGSFPHVSAAKYRIHKGASDTRGWEGFARVQADAARLNRMVVSALLEAGEPAVALQPSVACLARDGRLQQWDGRGPERCLARGLVPVPYGDVCFDETRGCCILSTEEIFRFLAPRLFPQRIIMAGKTDGVLDDGGNTIPELTPADLRRLGEAIAASDGVADVTGGMLHKVEKALESGVETLIVNGLRPGELENALLGRPVAGTLVIPG